MRGTRQTYTINDLTPLTAAQIAAALGISRTAVRNQLDPDTPTGKRTMSGNRTNTWRRVDLPDSLKSRLVQLAKAWTPPVPMAEISDECLTEADKLKRALLPSLLQQIVVSQADFEREGVNTFANVFGRKISTRHFRELIRRTRERDAGREDFNRTEIYLPARPEQKRQPAETKEQFPGLVSIINDGATPDEIWKVTFRTRAEMVNVGIPAPRAERQLRAFLMERARFGLSADALIKTFSRRLVRWQANESFDKRADTNGAGDSELTQQIKALSWFIPAGNFFYLITNRTKDSGSVPEAIRRVVSLPNLPAGWSDTIRTRFLKSIKLKIVPTCPDDLREMILARERAGKKMVPASIAKAITVKPHVMEQYRRPHETGLNYLQAPGTMMFLRNRNGTQEFARAGDILEADDGSINFPVCIPWTSPNGGLISETPCAANFGVIVGRFQWLRSIDAATRFRPGWTFVARPRGGFRGADVLTLMHGLTRQHGAWEEYRFERGVFKSNLVTRAVELLGSRLHTVISPHSKPFIEGGFNQDWTKLSVHFPQCDLGRYRGDTEQANKVVQACRAGRQDPRNTFPMLADAVAAFAEITAEENRTLVKSRNSGQWVPEEKWKRETDDRPLRQLDESETFMFAPYAMEWTIKGMLVGGRVPIFDDMSVPFEFTAPYLHEFNGAKVRLHFDPSAPKCRATPVLLQAWQGHRAGEVLPQLEQINETTGFMRTMLGWGDDVGTAGLRAKQQSAVAMRREVRTVMPGGRSGYARSEQKSAETFTSIERTAGGVEIKPDGKSESKSLVTRNLAQVEADKVTRRTAQRAEIELFERNNQHLLA